ncbi:MULTISPECIES: hypothetical protein [Caproicibacterium]|uniref:Uncharacterized protein n=1 Tax=Caproicibacterium argilliputei TaxID=3030016 RepID=A0AA97H1K0_9FIRM|nr:hypothetical protein [Caproicibacterium argilliputei]WOC32518.1 hypothetical protein PXC00_01225 [Caproicibacterium argilliputei]
MEDYNEKFKKVMSVLCAVGTIAAFTTFANASSYHTSSNLSAAHTQGDGSTYFQKVEYHVGSTKPFDDAYIYTEAGAAPIRMRQIGYRFAGRSSEQHSYSLIGSEFKVSLTVTNIPVTIPQPEIVTRRCILGTA